MRFATLALRVALVSALLPHAAAQRIPLAPRRSSAQDLEISGNLPGTSSSVTRYIRYADLLFLKQVRFTVHDDPNFSHPARLSGVALDELLRALAVPAGDQLIAAVCRDGYEAHYTAEYRAAHHPVLVLHIDGMAPSQWPRTPEGIPYGPYLISHPFFRPAFRVLADSDEAQIPFGVTALRILSEPAVLVALKPAGKYAGDSSAREGSRIAFQNCLRCHRDGNIGGSKAPFEWPQLALIAKVNPVMFGDYVVHPKSVNPGATMPGNPGYDAATIAALEAYFRSFAPDAAQ